MFDKIVAFIDRSTVWTTDHANPFVVIGVEGEAEVRLSPQNAIDAGRWLEQQTPLIEAQVGRDEAEDAADMAVTLRAYGETAQEARRKGDEA